MTGVPLLGINSVDQAYTALYAAAQEQGVTFTAQETKEITRHFKRALVACGTKAIARLEQMNGPTRASSIRKTGMEIRTLFARGGWDAIDSREPRKTGATAMRLRKAEQTAHNQASAAWHVVLAQAKAASYSVQDLKRKTLEIRDNAKGAGIYSEEKKDAIAATFAKACAQCCTARLERLATAPFMNDLSVRNMKKEEKTIKALYNNALPALTPYSPLWSIETAIQKAHARGVEAFMKAKGHEQMSIEDTLRVAYRVNRAGTHIKEKAKIDATLTTNVLMAGLRQPAPIRRAAQNRRVSSPEPLLLVV